MSNYMKLFPSFWTGETGRQMKKAGIETQLTALYLISNHHASKVGIYYLPIDYISIDVGISVETAFQAIETLCALGFCCYDHDAQYVWVCEMARYQLGEGFMVNANRTGKYSRMLSTLPELSFLDGFYKRY